MTLPRLTRSALARTGTVLPAPPVRIVHLGAGAFHRAHQAWYTAHADDADAWGIAAFTGRRALVAEQLAPQGGVFTLVERGPAHDRFEHVGSIVEAHAASDAARLRQLVAAPSTALVTLTVTEAGYHLRADGELDLTDPEIAADLRELRSDRRGALRTPLARLLDALESRRLAGAGPIAIVPCDNLPDNGGRLAGALAVMAAEAGLAGALAEASFVTTSVDRITPRTTDRDLAEIGAATGWHDEAPVVCEPFADWTLSGGFPLGRPAWETGGARVVDDVEAHARRKLLMLNGGHLALAFEGIRRGLGTVAEALADRDCRAALERFWDDAARVVDPALDTARYRFDLEQRFANGRIEHPLAQIAADTVTKLRLRIVPVIGAERTAGRDAAGALSVVSAWAACLRGGLLPGDGAHPSSLDSALDDLLAGAEPHVSAAVLDAVVGTGAFRGR